jgi:hypothetical protein
MSNLLRALRPAVFGPLTALFALSVATVGCDDGVRSGAAGTIDIDPQAFVFQTLRAGETADDTVRIKNVGLGTLFIGNLQGDFSTDFDLYFVRGDARGGDAGADQQEVAIRAGENRFPETYTLEPEETLTLVLNYHPSSDVAADGAVTFRTNDPANLDVTIPINSEQGAPQIYAEPKTLDFGRTPANAEKFLETVVSNLGQLPLNISTMNVAGNDFQAFIGDRNVTQDPAVLADPDGDGQPGLAPRSQFTLRVRYLTETEGPDSGEVQIVSDDPQSQTYVINLVANGAAPCVQVTPNPLDLPGTPVGQRNTRPLAVSSCGGEPLTIKSMKIVEAEARGIELDLAGINFPARLPAIDQNDPTNFPTRNFNVICAPDEQRAYGVTIEVETDDPINPVTRVPVRCRGVINACPVPRVQQNELTVRPLELIDLSGAASEDPDGPNGKPVKYRWNIVERPAGSTSVAWERPGGDLARPADGAVDDREDTPTAVLFAELLGTYVVELEVEDDLGQTAPSEVCPDPVARVTINVETDEDIHVQLVWDTPGDPDQTDQEGSDVDLHFLHPNGVGWQISPLDCYYANANPDWGVRGRPDDDPSLDIDDVNGAGPENLNLNNPEDTTALGNFYRVGVHYYRAENFLSGGTYGFSDVTIRVYLGGQLEWENEVPKRMQTTNQFWEVAQIVWTANEKRVRVIDRLR